MNDGAAWVRFTSFCAAGGYRALPATPVTVGRYVAYQWLKGTVQPSSVRTYLAPIRKRHIAAGFPNPCASDLVAEALAGFTNAWLDAHGSKPKRIALPASTAWRLAVHACLSVDTKLALRLTAVVAHFFMCRRAKDIINLKAADVLFLDDGALSFQIPRTKMDAKRPGGERLAHVFPATRFHTVADLPILLVRRAVTRHLQSTPANLPLFYTGTADPGDVLTGWLRAGLQLLAVTPPVGCVFASHSCRAGGCTAMRTVGVGLDAVAQWAGMAVPTLLSSYNDALAQVTPEAHYFFGRLLTPTLTLPA